MIVKETIIFLPTAIAHQNTTQRDAYWYHIFWRLRKIIEKTITAFTKTFVSNFCIFDWKKCQKLLYLQNVRIFDTFSKVLLNIEYYTYNFFSILKEIVDQIWFLEVQLVIRSIVTFFLIKSSEYSSSQLYSHETDLIPTLLVQICNFSKNELW